MKRVNLSHYKLFTGDMGLLYPMGLLECLPGDLVSLNLRSMIRMSPMAAPVMHGASVRMHAFFVPHRLCMDGWEEFIVGLNRDNTENTATIPQFDGPRAESDLLDYYGVPPREGAVSDLPRRGYYHIWNEYYRDQDIRDILDPNDPTNQQPERIAWSKDYFTTSRPWEQKGPAITIPLGSSAPIQGLAHGSGAGPNPAYSTIDGSPVEASNYNEMGVDTTQETPYVWADLSAATGIEISELRRAFASQKDAEDMARYGSRYAEWLIRTWGVRPDDGRIDRPEYLGGARARLNISEVLQTAPETMGDPHGTEFGVGDLYGHGVGTMRSGRINRFVPEHGYIHVVLSVRPDPIYQDAVPRHFLKLDREDFYNRHLANIGQQGIWQGEVYHGNGRGPEVFGYQDRYSEYTFQPSQIAGEFRDTLDYWHLARKFNPDVALNQDFIDCVPSHRIFNVQDYDTLWGMSHIGCRMIRRMRRNMGGSVI